MKLSPRNASCLRQRIVSQLIILGIGGSAFAVATGCSESTGADNGVTVDARSAQGSAGGSSALGNQGGSTKTKQAQTAPIQANGGSPSKSRGGSSGRSEPADGGTTPTSDSETDLGGASAVKTRGGTSNTGTARTTVRVGNGGGATGGAKSTGGATDLSGGASSSPNTNKGTKSAGGTTTSAGGVSSNSGSSYGVRLVGRADTSDPAGPKFAWSGSGVAARFNGSSIGVKLAGKQEFTVIVDGTVKGKLVAVDGINSVAKDLSAGEHTIELYRRTEAAQGESQFLGFDLGNGILLEPPQAPSRRIELIGDSISCGYGVEGADQTCGFSADTENHYLTYGAIAARSLGAELSTISWSGKGVVCNYGDAADSCKNPLPTYYDRALPDRASSSWDFSKFQPDAVVINLGTNDFSTQQDPTQGEFETAYKGFLKHIREKYPNAYILCTNGPMLSGTDLTTVRAYIENSVKSMRDAGDSRVGTFLLEPQLQADGYGCDWHPSCTTHQKVADVLVAALKKTLDW